MYIYIYIYIYTLIIYIYIYTYIYIYVHIYVYIYIYIYWLPGMAHVLHPGPLIQLKAKTPSNKYRTTNTRIKLVVFINCNCCLPIND